MSAVIPELPEDDFVQAIQRNSEPSELLRPDQTPSGFRYSLSRISPGAIACPNQFGSLVIVVDADFVDIAVAPNET